MRYTCESANQRINESANQRISESKLVVIWGGWVGFVYSSIRAFLVYSSIRFLSPDFGKAFDLSRHSHFRRQAFH